MKFKRKKKKKDSWVCACLGEEDNKRHSSVLLSVQACRFLSRIPVLTSRNNEPVRWNKPLPPESCFLFWCSSSNRKEIKRSGFRGCAVIPLQEYSSKESFFFKIKKNLISKYNSLLHLAWCSQARVKMSSLKTQWNYSSISFFVLGIRIPHSQLYRGCGSLHHLLSCSRHVLISDSLTVISRLPSSHMDTVGMPHQYYLLICEWCVSCVSLYHSCSIYPGAYCMSLTLFFHVSWT